ncbi:MAG: ATP-binding protein [Desulfosoma sp.]
MRDRPLFVVIRTFLHRRLLFPLVVLAVVITCALIPWRLVQLEEEHRLVSWGVDSYVSSLLESADENLRMLAQSALAMNTSYENRVFQEIPLSYHRVFFIEPDSYTVYRQGRQVPTKESVPPPPVSYFPEMHVWPIYSVPYYRFDLKAVTVATMIPIRGGTVVGELDLGRVQRSIDAYLRKVPHRIIWITDRYGNLIVHPDGRMVQEQENVGHEPLVAQALAHPEGARLLGRLAGTFVYGTSWRIDPWGWVVLVAYPLFPALYPVVGAATMGFLTFFAFLGLAHWRLMRRLQAVVVEPVESLTGEVQRMAEGHIGFQSSWPDSKGTFAELRVFAERFREMSRAVQEREEALHLRQKALLQVQESLKRSEKRYREILESIDEAYFELDADGIVTFHNSSFSRLFGLDPPPAHPFALSDMMLPETAKAMRDFFQGVAEGRHVGQLRTFEFYDVHGSLKIVEISARPMRAEEGSVCGVRVMARDVTEKIKAEKRAQELERILSHAQKMESLGTLASGIAHEFNNLLQAMTGYLELLARHTDPEDRKSRWIKHVQEAANRGAELVRRMLSFARQDDAKPEVVDINRLVHETLTFLRRNIPRLIRLEEDLAEDLPAIYADRLQLEQILINLVVNARDAIPEGTEGCIRVSTRSREPSIYGEGGGIVLTVSDTGQGIPESVQRRIFDPFFTTKEPGRGTGLGLSTVYGIVTRHGGSITCHSRVGQGTTFSITLPAHSSTKAMEQKSKSDAEEMSVSKRSRSRRNARPTVLVVDDEDDVRDLVSETLLEEGFRVLTASSGEEALDVLARSADLVDVLILDENMPGMGGSACFSKVRHLYPEVAVILASGSLESHFVESLGMAEHVAFLSKPYRLGELLAAIQRVMDH